MQGTVKWFDDKKGYGFITRSDEGKDLFVHFKDIVSTNSHRSLSDGDKVEFEVEEGAKGPKAIRVKKVG